MNFIIPGLLVEYLIIGVCAYMLDAVHEVEKKLEYERSTKSNDQESLLSAI